MRLLRLLRTVRHLRLTQVYGRVWRNIYHPRIDHRPSAPVRALVGEWQPTCDRRPSMLDATTFRFLNVTGRVRSGADWNDPRRARLWIYNAHYFDDLNADDATARVSWHRALIARWIDENPAAVGAGWEPYPTSLRITNWIKWSVSRVARGEDGLDEAARDSLAVQVRWLSRRIERHLMGNHLWANAKALVFAGVFFEGDEAAGWLRAGLELLVRELDEQVLADGGHFERSPMYHAIVLEDVLDLINLSLLSSGEPLASVEAPLRSAAMRMHRWLRVMTHPDGEIALFNDAAFGIAPCAGVLALYAKRLGVPVSTEALRPLEALPESGYVRLQNARAVLICDVAPVGPDYLPGHAHADTLSFELSLDGQRVVVNSGTSTYDEGTERLRQRGTAAHNTVEVDHLDSLEMWGSFRVARRARAVDVRWGDAGSTLWVEAAHDGYRRLRTCVTHRRHWILEEGNLTIQDRIDGHVSAAVAALHLHPEVSVGGTPANSKGAALGLVARGNPLLSVTSSAGLSVSPSTWHPEFGLSVPNTVIQGHLARPANFTRLAWK